MFINANLIFFSAILLTFFAALGWGVVLGEDRERKRIPVPATAGYWHTIVFRNIPKETVQEFIDKWERRGFQFLSETRANGDSYSTLFLKQWIGV